MNTRFAFEKEHILSQYILHHEVSEQEVPELARRLDYTVEVADRLHTGQRRRSGEEYIHHPVRTAMEVSRFGRIVDWAAIEASLLHDTLEDTAYSPQELERDFPGAALLVHALTKIKDSRELTYQKLFRYVLQDIRVLLVKLADRLDNLESLQVFSRDKQMRIARESVLMYANICRRLCMTDLADRLTEKAGQFLIPDKYSQFQAAQREAEETAGRSMGHLRSRIAEIFPGDLGVRVEIRRNRFNPDLPLTPENLFTVRIVTDHAEDAYRSLGRIHLAYRAIPGTFSDTITNPRKNGYRALETNVASRGGIVRFYIAPRSADRYNRLGLLSMDIESPQFNMEYLDDLREFLQSEDGNIQDFLRFQLPDAIQVTSPKGEVFGLEEDATALDFAFAVHKELGLRAIGAWVNDQPSPLNAPLQSGDRVYIETAPEPACDERYLSWCRTRRAQAALRRHLRREESVRASAVGRQWLMEAGRAEGLTEEAVELQARRSAEQEKIPLDALYRDICLGKREIESILAPAVQPQGRVGAIVRALRPGRPLAGRKVHRYEFADPHIRFCPWCVPVRGDEIEGVSEKGRLLVHQRGCARIDPATALIRLDWDRDRKSDLRDPGLIELALEIKSVPGLLNAVVGPFRDLGVEVDTLTMPGADKTLRLVFRPLTARTLDRLMRAFRKLAFVQSLRVHRALVRQESEDASPEVPANEPTLGDAKP